MVINTTNNVLAGKKKKIIATTPKEITIGYIKLNGFTINIEFCIVKQNINNNMKKVTHLSFKHTKTLSQLFWKWFWLTFLVVSLAYAWYSFYVPSNDIAWDNRITSTEMLTKHTNKNALLFFTADWCVPCRIMKRNVFADKAVMQQVNMEVTPVIIDINNPNTKELVTHYQIGATPTTILVDTEGTVLDYAVGKIEKEKFLEMLNNLNTIK